MHNSNQNSIDEFNSISFKAAKNPYDIKIHTRPNSGMKRNTKGGTIINLDQNLTSKGDKTIRRLLKLNITNTKPIPFKQPIIEPFVEFNRN